MILYGYGRVLSGEKRTPITKKLYLSYLFMREKVIGSFEQQLDFGKYNGGHSNVQFFSVMDEICNFSPVSYSHDNDSTY